MKHVRKCDTTVIIMQILVSQLIKLLCSHQACQRLILQA